MHVHLGETNERSTWFFPLATFVLVVAVLRVAEDVLMPVAFAVLLAFLLSPLVVRLTRWGFNRGAAIAATVIVAFSALGAVGWIVSSQAISLIRELPNYEHNIQQKISALKQPATPTVVSRMAGMIENIRKEIKAPSPEKLAEAAREASNGEAEAKPIPVEVHPADPTPLEVARDIVSPILGPLGLAAMIMVLVIVMLFQREDLRDRFLKLVSAGKLNVATQAVDDAATRVSRYLGMQLVVNATYGIPIGLGLYLIGIPNALLWGLLATLLRFIPFVGPWIAASFPLALAIAVDPGWSKFFFCAGLFIVMEIISNNWIELWLYGASTGISNFALLIAAVFWTWLWGPAGLVLSTPLTVCLLVIGNYVPGFKFLSMVLGSEPVLDPPSQFYQRMLSMESEDMLELATKFIEDRSLEEFYDDVFVPALMLSEQDRHSGALSADRQRFIFQSSRELIEELERQEELAKLEKQPGSLAPFPVTNPKPPVVLGVAARDDADEIVALMLAHLLRRHGLSAATTPRAITPEGLATAIERHHVKAVLISALPPSAVVGARQMWRRLTLRYPHLPMFVGVWRHTAALDELASRLRLNRAEEVVTTLQTAVQRIEKMLQSDTPPPAAAEPLIEKRS